MKEGIFWKLTLGLVDKFMRIWFFMWLWWVFVMVGLVKVSSSLEPGDWIITILITMIGFMLSLKFWTDSLGVGR